VALPSRPFRVINEPMVETVNVVCGLPDDGKVKVLRLGREPRFSHEGTASFLTQTMTDLP
jgi:hypothetical protein